MRRDTGRPAVAPPGPSRLGEQLTALSLDANPVVRRALEVPRKDRLDPEAFAREHLAGAGAPVVATDAMDRWPARNKWSFEFFRERYPDDEIVANSPYFLEPDLGLEPVRARMRLRDYIDYVLDPRQAPRGEYLLGDLEALRRNRLPLYEPSYRVLALHPELAADVAPSLYFVDDLFSRLPPPVQRFLDLTGSPVHYLFFAPRGSVAFLHTDYWSTHAYLAQLAGRKLCVLFSPEDDEHVYRGAIRNPFAVDLRRFPRFERAIPHLAILEAGDTLVIPSGWWHFVIGLAPSLTYSYDFFTAHNMSVYFSHLFSVIAEALADPGRIEEDVARAAADLLRELRAELEAAGGARTRPGP